jgi:divalent metal cation (Fe/Co/Zn/Cd) transporter
MSSVQHIVLLGSLSNLFLAASKFGAGWYYDSNALTAEGWHSIADLAMDAVTAFTVFLSSQFSSKGMSGSRYIENSGSLVISSIVCVGGFRTLWQSWSDLKTSLPRGDRQVPGVEALWIPLLTIITKEIVHTISK